MTKENWSSFIEKCRESHRKAYIHDLSISEGKSTPKQEKPSKSLVERFKGYFENRAKEKAERKEQEQARKPKTSRRKNHCNGDESLEAFCCFVDNYVDNYVDKLWIKCG